MTGHEMQDMESCYATWAPRILGVLRVIVGLLFIVHGSAKLFGVLHIAMYDGLQPFSLPGFAGMLEFGGGIMMLLGLCTRPPARAPAASIARGASRRSAPTAIGLALTSF